MVLSVGFEKRYIHFPYLMFEPSDIRKLEIKAELISPNEVVKIKSEIDTDPSAYANFESKYRLLPTSFS